MQVLPYRVVGDTKLPLYYPRIALSTPWSVSDIFWEVPKISQKREGKEDKEGRNIKEETPPRPLGSLEHQVEGVSRTDETVVYQVSHDCYPNLKKP